MKRLLSIIMLIVCVLAKADAQYYSVNYDKQTVAAMAAAYGTEAVAEAYYNEQVQNILKHYNAAEVASAGIYASKFLERKAMTELGIWNSSTGNYYYRRIYNMVSGKIMPKIWTVAGMMLKSPQTALYWGTYLMKICDDTKNLCMQFESVVTNSTLTFSDIAFLQINQEIAAILKLSEIGNVDWKKMLDDLSKVSGNFTVDNLKSDIDNLYKAGANLAGAGMNNIGNALLQSSQFNDLFQGKLSAAIDIVDNYSSLFKSLDKCLFLNKVDTLKSTIMKKKEEQLQISLDRVKLQKHVYELCRVQKLTINEVRKKTGLGMGTIYRYLHTFEEENPKLVEQMKKQGPNIIPEDYKKLQEEVLRLKCELKRERLRADFYEEMVAFGKEVYGIDLKKAGTK